MARIRGGRRSGFIPVSAPLAGNRVRTQTGQSSKPRIKTCGDRIERRVQSYITPPPKKNSYVDLRVGFLVSCPDSNFEIRVKCVVLRLRTTRKRNTGLATIFVYVFFSLNNLSLFFRRSLPLSLLSSNQRNIPF